MILVTVKATPISGFLDEYIEQFNLIAEEVRKEKGCIEYELYRKNADDNTLFLFERWDSQQCLDAHLNSEHMLRFFSLTNAWFDKPKEIKMYQV